MAIFLSAILAFVVASIFTAIELLTTDYPRTYFVFTPSNGLALYGYSAIYGAIAFGVVLGLDGLTAAGFVQIEGFGVGNLWVRAIIVGLSVKAFLHIRLVSVNTGGPQPFPIGLETLVQIFEPWLLRTIYLDEWNGVRAYVTPRAQQYTDLEEARQRIAQNLPERLGEAERAAFLADMDQAQTVQVLMSRYLRLLGRETFNGTFPPT